MDEEALVATRTARDVSKRAASDAKRVPADSFDRAVWLALLLLIGVAILLAGGVAGLVAILR